MTLRLTIGIDPGLTGAIAFLADGEPCGLFDMPTEMHGDWKEVDGGKLAEILREGMKNHTGANVSACIEKVGARPTDGGTSAFRFGESSGKAKAVLEALRIPYMRVVPVTWKRSYGLIKAEKGKSIELAVARFPAVAASLKRQKDDGRAEALLLALYHYNNHHFV